MLSIKDLRKSYKDIAALKSLSFDLAPGTCTALLGPNGAGKSTAIKVMVTLLPPDGGQFLWNNQNLFEKPAEIRNLLGYVSQEMAMDKQMTGAEFMRFCAGLMHLDWKQHKDRAHSLLKQMGLDEAKDRLVGEYSGGMKRRLDLASSLLNEPKILVLDEPTTGLDIEARERIWQLIRNFMKDGGSLILASHDFREVQELADDVLILQKGQVAAHGPTENLKQAVGDLIIKLKTREFMDQASMDAVKPVFQFWGEEMTWRPDDEEVTLTYRGDTPMHELQAKIYEVMNQAGRDVYALSVRKPELEDVYRFSVGGNA